MRSATASQACGLPSTRREASCPRLPSQLGNARTIGGSGRPFAPSRGGAQVCRAATMTRIPRWEPIWQELVVQRNFQSSTPEEVAKKVRSGKMVLVDVRPKGKYESSHPEGAVNVPLYQKTDFSKPSLTKYARALMLMANGVEPVEPNPDFVEDLKAAAAGGKGVALACETGGTVVPTPSFGTGKVSRSLQAVWLAFRAGLPDVAHVRGGVYGWARAGLPFVGEYDSSGIGRTPNAVGEE